MTKINDSVRQEVADLLSTTDMPMAQIAKVCGISSTSVRRINKANGDLFSQREEIAEKRKKKIEETVNMPEPEKKKPRKVMGTSTALLAAGILGFIGGCTYWSFNNETEVRDIAEKLEKKAVDYAVSETFQMLSARSPYGRGSDSKATRKNFEIYTVADGDNLIRISEEYEVSVDSILKANPEIKDKNKIWIGQDIMIPFHNVDEDGKHNVDEDGKKDIKSMSGLEKEIFSAPGYKWPDRKNLVTEIRGADRHYGGKNFGIDKIVLHITDSEGKSAENWFTLPNEKVPKGMAVSAHYIIEKDGTIVQIVPDDVVAYHCAGENKGSIGIEFVGKLYDPEKQTLTQDQVASGVKLVCHLQGRYSISDEEIFGHSNYSYKECPGKKNLEVMKSELEKYKP